MSWFTRKTLGFGKQKENHAGWRNLISRRLASAYRAGLSYPAARGLGGRCTGRHARGEFLRESRGRVDRPPALLTAQTAAWRVVFGLIEGFCHIRWLRSARLHMAWADFEKLRQTAPSGVARPGQGGGHLARRAPRIIGVPHHDTPRRRGSQEQEHGSELPGANRPSSRGRISPAWPDLLTSCLACRNWCCTNGFPTDDGVGTVADLQQRALGLATCDWRAPGRPAGVHPAVHAAPLPPYGHTDAADPVPDALRDYPIFRGPPEIRADLSRVRTRCFSGEPAGSRRCRPG